METGRLPHFFFSSINHLPSTIRHPPSALINLPSVIIKGPAPRGAKQALEWVIGPHTGDSPRDFKTLAEAKEAGASVFAYGQFCQNILDFLIIALCIFFMIKAVNKMKKKEERAPEAPAGPTQEELLTEIRDLLKKK